MAGRPSPVNEAEKWQRCSEHGEPKDSACNNGEASTRPTGTRFRGPLHADGGVHQQHRSRRKGEHRLGGPARPRLVLRDFRYGRR